MKLKALFLGGMLALGFMSFSSSDKSQSAPIQDQDVTCNGSTNPCCASPGKFLG